MVTFIISFLLFLAWHVFGTSIGYHRLLTHRAVKTFKPIEYFFVAGGYLALEGSPIWWATMHRAHHRYSDTELDPHTPRKGVKHSYNGWLNKRDYPEHISPQKQAADLVSDPVYAYLEQDGDLRKASKLCLYINVGFRLALLLIGGPLVFVASLLAGFIGHQLPLLINVICHIDRFGYRNFETTDDSINVWWLALATGGEAWHNNHHANPGSARFGLRAFEFDASWTLLKILQGLGLVSKINEATWSPSKAGQEVT